MKKTISKVKRQPSEKEKIIAKETTDKDLISKMYKATHTAQYQKNNLGLGKFPWRREWLPTPVFLPGEFHGQGSLAGHSLRGRKEPEITDRLTLSPSYMQTVHLVQWLSRVQLDATDCMLRLPKLAQTHVESVMPSNHPPSVVPFSSCLQPFPGSGFFPVSQLFESGGQSIGASVSATDLPMNSQD